jgi:soluble lytic murein transglycosylase
MENVLVYRARFEGSGAAVAGKDVQRVTVQDVNAAPTASAAAPSP